MSSNQASNAIVWALDNSTYKNSRGAVLCAFDATNLANELYDSTAHASRDSPGPAVKFAVPTVANGKVLGWDAEPTERVRFVFAGGGCGGKAQTGSGRGRNCRLDSADRLPGGGVLALNP